MSLSNLQVLNAVLYVAENGFRWRGLSFEKLDVLFIGFLHFALIVEALR